MSGKLVKIRISVHIRPPPRPLLPLNQVAVLPMVIRHHGGAPPPPPSSRVLVTIGKYKNTKNNVCFVFLGIRGFESSRAADYMAQNTSFIRENEK